MKTVRILGLLTLAMLLNIGAMAEARAAVEQAGYYRVWQGFKKAEITTESFQQQLPAFMNSTTEIYKNVLNNYLVAVPPANKPAFVPDEFALVALRSEADYKTIRATDAGKAYADSHWNIFARDLSASAPYSNFFPALPAQLESNKSYDVIGAPVDWTKGANVFFLGVRKGSISKADYLARLSQHLDLVTRLFGKIGMKGYIVISNENYEAAYINWESADAMHAALDSPAGKTVGADAASIMDILMWNDAVEFDRNTVVPGNFYDTQDKR